MMQYTLDAYLRGGRLRDGQLLPSSFDAPSPVDVSQDNEENESYDFYGNLSDDLFQALESPDLSFKSSYYHASVQHTTPNPCLTISGLGLVSLPLTECEAKTLISYASLANKDACKTWEIEAAKVSFANDEWLKWVQTVACQQISKSLGVQMAWAPRMELHKLLVCEPGSQFLPHQTSRKGDGIFGTAIILLPTAYTGGQVIVSHWHTTEILDYSSDSLTSTALLAWYTHVKRGLKPVTSGHRLALFYNLVAPQSTGLRRPALPNSDETAVILRAIFSKWKNGSYKNIPKEDFVAYILEHQYSNSDLGSGEKCLKGRDRHRVALVREVAKPLGFIVCLGTWKHYVRGLVCRDMDDERAHSKKKRYRREDWVGSDNESSAGTSMWVTEQEMPDMESDPDGYGSFGTIERLVDLDGNSLMDSAIKLKDDSDVLLPKSPWEVFHPDEQEYEGMEDYCPGILHHWYRRTVLFLMHQSKQDDIIFSAGGIGYAIDQLSKSKSALPSPKDKLWMSRIVDCRHSMNAGQTITIMEYAKKWKDIKIWNAVTNTSACKMNEPGVPDTLRSACATFGFESVKASFEGILARTHDVKTPLDFIISLPKFIGDDGEAEILAWSKRQLARLLTSHFMVDVGSLMYIIKVVGLETFNTTVARRIFTQEASYSLCIKFVIKIDQSRPELIQNEVRILSEGSLPPSIDAQQNIDTLIHLILTAAASHWAQDSRPTFPSSRAPATLTHKDEKRGDVARIMEIVGHCLDLNCCLVCEGVFTEMVKSSGSSQNLLRNYLPMIQPLCDLLREKKQDVASSPFGQFLGIIIIHYLQTVLGREGEMTNFRLHGIGCGAPSCKDCKALDIFMTNPSVVTQTYQVAKARRLHLEDQAQRASDLCTFETIRSRTPHSVKITKRPEIFALGTWEARQRDAQAFLALIGGTYELQNIMGARFVDLQNALAGITPFVLSPADIRLVHLGRPPNIIPPHPATGSSGTKRKNGPHRQK